MEDVKIEYPRRWTYRVIGTDENLMRKAVLECLKKKKHQLTSANKSSSGKYVSLNLEVEVNSEKMRNDIFHCINKHPSVKMVL